MIYLVNIYAKNFFVLPGSSCTLSHACRKKIVQQFASSGSYNKDNVCSLPVPSILHEYLLFTEYGTNVSEIVQDSLKYLSIKTDHVVVHGVHEEQEWG